MRDWTDIWRERPAVWVPALIFFCLNLALVSAYHVAFSGQAQMRAGRIERLEQEARRLESERAALEKVVGRAEENRERIQEFYDRWLTSEEQRLTRVIAEVKSLARRSGVEPTVLSYPEEELEEHGLMKRSIVFAVDGSYLEVRRLINFLELSDLFLTLEEVRLSGGDDETANLRINLKISTLFRESAAPDRDAGARAVDEA